VSGLEFAELPLLWSDGEHDDSRALTALVKGKPVRCAKCMGVIGDGCMHWRESGSGR
jgi:hypothetical protein